MTSQADRMSFVSVNGNNVFQVNRVKLCVVTFVCVYFVNIGKKTFNYHKVSLLLISIITLVK